MHRKETKRTTMLQLHHHLDLEFPCMSKLGTKQNGSFVTESTEEDDGRSEEDSTMDQVMVTYEDVALVHDENNGYGSSRIGEHGFEDDATKGLDGCSLSSSFTSLDRRAFLILEQQGEREDVTKMISTTMTINKINDEPFAMSYENVAIIIDSVRQPEPYQAAKLDFDTYYIARPQGANLIQRNSGDVSHMKAPTRYSYEDVAVITTDRPFW